MKYPYYPGCTLYSKARNLDRCGRRVAEALGVQLVEMPSWNCCGAIFNTASDDLAAYVGPVRNLAKASQMGDEDTAQLPQGGGAGGTQGTRLVTLCAACHNVLKRAQAWLFAPGNERERARLLEFVDERWEREVRVVHYLEVLKEDVTWDGITRATRRPLGGLKVASYYGCLMVRPAGVLTFDDPENPVVMDNLVSALGGVPVRFDFKTECCGGYLVVNRRAVAQDCSLAVVENARDWGAEVIITTCPLCQYNLETAQMKAAAGSSPLPVVYFTQLVGVALGLPEEALGFEDNKLDPRPFFLKRGLL